MSKNSTKKKEIHLRRLEVQRLFLRGIKSQYEIADRLDVHFTTIGRDLRALDKQWQESALINTDKAKSERLAEIQEIKAENWEAYKRSCEEFKSKTLKAKKNQKNQKKGKKAKDEMPQTAEQILKTEERCGDPRYLANILDAIKEEAKIIGIYADTKHRITGKDGGPIQQSITIETRKKIREEIYGIYDPNDDGD